MALSDARSCRLRWSTVAEEIVEIVRLVLLDKCSSRDWIDSFPKRSLALVMEPSGWASGANELGAHRCSSPVR